MLLSCPLKFGVDADRKYFKRKMKICAKRIVEEYMEDNMKAPYGNKARPALFAPSAFNIYFGENAGYEKNRLVRYQYGSCTGNCSIGLDPRHLTIFPLFPELNDLRNLVRDRCKRHFAERPDVCCDFNQVSIKLYYHGKVLKLHTDLDFDELHLDVIDKNNSQLPMSTVALCTLGDDKVLQFVAFEGGGTGKPVKGTKPVAFTQKNFSCIVLDPSDEYLDCLGKFWKHESFLVDKKQGVCMTLAFRVVKTSAAVYAKNNKLVDKTVPGTGKKRKQFDDGWELIRENHDEYNKKKTETLLHIRNVLGKYYNRE